MAKAYSFFLHISLPVLSFLLYGFLTARQLYVCHLNSEHILCFWEFCWFLSVELSPSRPGFDSRPVGAGATINSNTYCVPLEIYSALLLSRILFGFDSRSGGFPFSWRVDYVAELHNAITEETKRWYQSLGELRDEVKFTYEMLSFW